MLTLGKRFVGAQWEVGQAVLINRPTVSCTKTQLRLSRQASHYYPLTVVLLKPF